MIRIFSDHCSAARAAAEHIVAVGRRCVAERGRFDWVLSGGKTPEETYRTLAEKLHDDCNFWKRTHIYWGDERCVPSHHPQSNYSMAKRSLLDLAGVAPDHIHPILTDAADPLRVAEQYEKVLPESPDLLMLGVGEDGHTASLFPHSPALDEAERRVVVVEAWFAVAQRRRRTVEPRLRISVTPPVLAAAREVVVLVVGSNKAAALARVFAADGDFHETPARLVRDATWFADRDAAQQIIGMDVTEVYQEDVGRKL